jgi:predicted amidohydrolase YtcJ
VLKESAQALLGKVIPRATHDEKLAAIRAASAYAHRLGVTSVQSTSGTVEDAALFAEAEQKGDLSVRTYYSLLILPGFSEADADRFEATRKQNPDGARFRTGIVKLSLDGVIESRTAALLAPYAGSTSSGCAELPGGGAEPDCGDDGSPRLADSDSRHRRSRRADDPRRVRARDRGQPAARARARHRIEHVETIDPADIPRFAKLGVIASMQPIHAELGDMNSLHPSGPWP